MEYQRLDEAVGMENGWMEDGWIHDGWKEDG